MDAIIAEEDRTETTVDVNNNSKTRKRHSISESDENLQKSRKKSKATDLYPQINLSTDYKCIKLATPQ